MDELFERIWAKKFVFLGTFFIVFTLTYVILLALDFLPEKPSQEEEVSEGLTDVVGAKAPAVIAEEGVVSESPATVESRVELPLSISIEKLDKTIVVLNPVSRTIADLDTALLSGVVRHPDSATLDQDGNVFILGHSSYLPNVFNKNFQAFNGIQNLEWGDIIEVQSDVMLYQYRVEKVYRANAQDVTVPIADTGKMLTLATCNSFGSVDDRYIVEAKQIKAEAL